MIADVRPRACARLGSPGAVLLAGPPATVGPEPFDAYLRRVGATPLLPGAGVLEELRASGLRGRGGGGFPLWRKLEAALESGHEPTLVVNCSESEPASHKDRTLCTYRPHTVLEGAAILGSAVGARRIVLHAHRGKAEPGPALARALEERGRRPADPEWHLSTGPGGYVAGEASAVARYLHTGAAAPLFSSVPLARRGPDGRPTIVSNAETVAHVATIARVGGARWRADGPGSAGSHLVTLSGAVAMPGAVLELVGEATVGDVLRDGGLTEPPQAVLVGGYAGSWITGDVAWGTTWSPEGLGAAGVSPGCGLLAVLPHGFCGLAETARLVRYLAGESAGQCGPCVHGLPALSKAVSALARGAGGRSALGSIRRVADALPGSGACAHPDGVVRLVRSALDAFGDDVARHRRRRPCSAASDAGVFPVPAGGTGTVRVSARASGTGPSSLQETAAHPVGVR